MRLLLVGGACAEIAAAAALAAARGAAVRHVATLEAALEQLRAGRGADLLHAGRRRPASTPRSRRLTAERIFLPVVAYGVDCTPEQAAAAIKAGAAEFLPLPPEAELIAAILAAVGRRPARAGLRRPAHGRGAAACPPATPRPRPAS